MENPYEPESGTSGNHTSPDTLDDEWLTLVAPLDEDDDLDRAIEADKERWRQEAQQFNWTSVMDQLFAVYIDLKGRTKNWSGQNAYTPFVRCNCLPQEKRSRFVDMVDIFSQHRIKFKFCNCTSNAVCLLKHGFLPASPIRPQTAFSLPLLIFHHHLWNNCQVGTFPFTTALRDWLEPRSERLFARKQKH
ncbi:hypothetical protein PTTG_09505, partial [Puccinia triticina 1-1 BBBD Race 1]